MNDVVADTRHSGSSVASKKPTKLGVGENCGGDGRRDHLPFKKSSLSASILNQGVGAMNLAAEAEIRLTKDSRPAFDDLDTYIEIFKVGICGRR